MDYIIIKIGCLECERDSTLIGKYHSKEKADKECAKLQEEWEKSQDVHSDFKFEVFEIPANYS